MGGITRIIRSLPGIKAIAPKAKAIAPTPKPAPVADITKTPVAAETKKATFGGSTQQTILTSAQGVEDEANVAKTVLGGATKKKKQTNNFGY
tara:strand:+ start:1798 stop:2073 length:276 start_codon:yes stop_codon:yes gene_type:complete